MESTLHLRHGVRMRDNFTWIFYLIGLLFALYYLYLNLRYNYYTEDYRNAQQQEIKKINDKTTETIQSLRALANILGKTILSTPEDYRKIQRALATGLSVSQGYDKTPTIHHLSYYKLSASKAIITPSAVVPLYSLPVAFHKPLKDLESLTIKDNELVGMVPVFDSNKNLKGVLEIKVPSVDIQKFLGVDNLTTLIFPQMFDGHGKKMVQSDPLDFSLKNPLSYVEYIMSYALHFWILVYAAVIGSIVLFFGGIFVKKHTGLAFGDQIGHLNKKLDSLSSHSSSLEQRTMLQGDIIQRSRQLGGALHKSAKAVEVSDEGMGPFLSYDEKKTLIKATAALAEDLSTGLWQAPQKETISVEALLKHIKIYFTDQIQKLNLKYTFTCPQGLKFEGDPLFTKIVLANIIGIPLCSMPKEGKISIVVTQENGFVYIEIKGKQYALSAEAKKYLKFPPELLIENNKLREICLQHGIGYQSETQGGEFCTLISFSLTPEDVQESNVISFSRTLH